LIWTFPLRTDAELASLYHDRESKDFVPGDVGPIALVKDMIARAQLRGLARRMGRVPSSMLDLGTGNGRYALAAHALGWPAVSASDMHESAPTAIARVNARTSAAASVRFIRQRDLGMVEGAFDFVLYRAVLEHTADPNGALRAIRALLRPGGLCYLEVPNIRSWSVRTMGYAAQSLYLPWHRVHFTGETLEATVRAAGLTPFAGGGKTMPKIADQLQHAFGGFPRLPAQIVGAVLQPVQLLLEGMLGSENLWLMARREG
jgi:SAM-dependent methyltransferase